MLSDRVGPEYAPLVNNLKPEVPVMRGAAVLRVGPIICRSRYIPFALHTRQGQASETQTAANRDWIPVINPATGDEICSVASANAEDVSTAIEDAHNAFKSGTWSRASPIMRSEVLVRLANLLRQRIPDFARIETLQTGRTIREMTTQLGRLPDWLDYYAALLRMGQSYVAPTQGKLLNYVQRIPLGVVAQITPFNHPLLIALKKIAPALAAGNSVVVKPSELAPITVLEFAELAAEAGVPEGVLSVLPGYGAETGKRIVSHPLVRKVDITAGTSTGRAIGSIVGANLASYTAELGGKESAPIVIFDDADLTTAVNGAAFACFVASGQTCVSGARILVQDRIYETFMAHFLDKVATIRRHMGDPLNPLSMMGTVISPVHLGRIQKMVQDHQDDGVLMAGGERMYGTSDLDGFNFEKGAFFPPTVITDIDLNSPLWKEEIFGPVVVAKRFQTEEEGVILANECKYGLGAAIWTRDLSRAHRIAADFEAGLVWVNTHHRNDPSSPWGGMKESGIGRENGLEAYHAYTQTKSTIVNIASVEESREKDDWFSGSEEQRRYG